jgi:hypothetical protein
LTGSRQPSFEKLGIEILEQMCYNIFGGWFSLGATYSVGGILAAFNPGWDVVWGMRRRSHTPFFINDKAVPFLMIGGQTAQPQKGSGVRNRWDTAESPASAAGVAGSLVMFSAQAARTSLEICIRYFHLLANQ